jgi:hypothetical protein
MALLHKATLVPPKLDLVGAWAREQPWFEGDKDAALTQVGNFRFDDPAGEVGLATLLVRVGDGPVVQLPVTYRDAPLAGAAASLIGTLEHSVLGTRWVYDGPGDPVFVAATTTAIVGGQHEAEMWIEEDGVLVKRELTTTVVGSGGAADGELEIIRVPENSTDTSGYATLLGTWPGHPEPAVLARIRA